MHANLATSYSKTQIYLNTKLWCILCDTSKDRITFSTYSRNEQECHDTGDEQQDQSAQESVKGIRIVSHEHSNHSQHHTDDKGGENRNHDDLGVPELLDPNIECLEGEEQAGQEVHPLVDQQDRQPVAGGLRGTGVDDQGHRTTL